ncbi:6,7-dimethyl-8-ribityllumazine synthase [Patescibacteria group bacterium]|nr:6,7-dimethyl-8-ribityllumazine synthase [Patescibacteria group bacterium]MBU1015555.1 6,7-dimethyl-8-ribityllumazine synthase [Patescibacteria group bacterium]MBU1685606.1 6,7-dimethyl-8-ribityllumazine synthase [Patescibacteria group bacterium]MBU1938976.1 6,7-dimethyl-8-ribityllumazine synthase [Patescibacteria group bacterium]
MSSIKKNIAGKSFKANKGLKVGIVQSEYNSEIGDALYKNCLSTLLKSGVSEKNIRTVKVPGAFEIPYACQKLASSKQYDVIISLGVIIRGETPHFEYIAGSCSKGIMDVSLRTGTPVIFGILTVNNLSQAKARADKGTEAALSALQIANLNF